MIGTLAVDVHLIQQRGDWAGWHSAQSRLCWVRQLNKYLSVKG